MIELSALGETKVEEETLVPSLVSDLGVDSDFPIFVPAMSYDKGGRPVTIHLMEGYVFVGSGLPETSYFALEKRPYITQVMHGFDPHGIRVLKVVPNKVILDLRKQLRKRTSSNIRVHDFVRVTEGSYRALDGKIVALDKARAEAYVLFDLRSLKTVAKVPLALLEDLQVAEERATH